MKKILALWGVLTLSLCLNVSFAADETEVEKKTIAINAILDSVYKNPTQREKYMTVFKTIFEWCSKTCENEVSKKVSAKVLETYDEKYLWAEKKTEEVKEGITKNEETKVEETKVEVKSEEKKVEATESKLIDPTKPFTLGWIEYEIIWFRTFDFIWNSNTKYSDYRKFPENDKWLLLEFTYKNVSEYDDKYMWSFVIINWENQYNKSSTASVYAKYQLWYDSNNSKPLKKWAKEKAYYWYDIKESDIWKWRLVLEGWWFSDDDIDIDITKIPLLSN